MQLRAIPPTAAPEATAGRGGAVRAVLAGAITAVLLNLPFPVAGPLPPWRGAVAWLALVPLLVYCISQADLRRSAVAGYSAGVLWYLLNCYWIYATMHIYGNLGAATSAAILLLFSLILGLYFALFAALVALARMALGRWIALVLAPAFWVATEYAAAHITNVPWDQLGYSQVDNLLLTRLAPWTGVYGISFVLAGVNAALAAAGVAHSVHHRIRLGTGAVLTALLLQLGSFVRVAPSSASSTAVLLQENLDVDQDNQWIGPEWDARTAEFLQLSVRPCTPYYAGMPPQGPGSTNTRQPLILPRCDAPQPIRLIAWPEAPSPFREKDPRFQQLASSLARSQHSAVVAGNIAVDQTRTGTEFYNAASFFAPDGSYLGRYDKIHLVPFGEYVPYADVFSFAGHLTQNVSDFARGKYRRVFFSGGHSYGIFICYESIFADEVRHFALSGAEVFVNISDDAWYGDTSAPWQHLNMARMRAIENRRWLLRDTNSGVTAAIDPLGRVTQSAPRHVLTSLAVHYGFRDGLTFYTRYGDLFAWLCVIISLVAAARAVRAAVRQSSVKRQV